MRVLRTSRSRLAVGGAVSVCAGLLATAAVLMPEDAGGPEGPPDVVTLVLVSFFVLTTAGVGGLIIARFPSNAVGWVLAGTALSWAMASFGLGYIEHSRLVGELPGAGYFIVTQSLWNVGFVGPATMLPLLFPTGRPINERGRYLVRAAFLLLGVLMVATTLAPEAYLERMGNPYSTPVLRDMAAALQPVLYFALLPVGVLSLLSLVLRIKRAGWIERQQLKWLVFAVALVVAATILVTILESVGIGGLGNLLAAASLSAIPLAIGVAILRHRLYDVDLVINRALVYGALTAILAGAYLGLVVLLQGALRPITSDSDLAVAGSTLAVAALFRPLRSRVQSFIDRRFYRSKYDATETLETFASRLRDRVDLASLSSELVTVVGHTMQPAHASLWLKESR